MDEANRRVRNFSSFERNLFRKIRVKARTKDELNKRFKNERTMYFYG